MPYVFSRTFWNVHDATGPAGATYTVPAGMVAVLRYCGVTFGGVGSPTATLLHGTGPVVINTFDYAIATGGSKQWSGQIAFAAGETFYLNLSDAMDTQAGGYLFVAS